MGKLDELLKQRQALQKRAEIHLKIVATYNEGTPSGKVTVALQEAEAMSKLLEANLVHVIGATTDDEGVGDAATIHSEINAIIMDMKAHLLELSTPTVAEKRDDTPSGVVTRCSVKLPKLELPTFDGKYEEWVSFKDLFTASVVDNKGLSDSQRLQYLKAQLKGEPLGLVSSIAVTDANWESAWGKIADRYENTRLIVTSIISKLINLKCLNSESVLGLRKLLDTTQECISALEVLGVPVNFWDDILIVSFIEKLDPETRKQWSLHNTSKLMPSWKELSDFVETYIRALTASSSKPGTHGASASAGVSKERKEAATHFVSGDKCPVCTGAHLVYKCPKFLKSKVDDRWDLARTHRLCFNCLEGSHGVLSCPVETTCKVCDIRHHVLLHFQSKGKYGKSEEAKDMDDTDGKDSPPKSSEATTVVAHTAFSSPMCHAALQAVLLSTAVVLVRDKWGSFQYCRVLLDPGSQVSFVSESCRARLGWTRKASNVVGVTGVQNMSVGKPMGQIDLKLLSCYSDFCVSVTCLVFDQVTGALPNFKCDKVEWEHIQGLDLADPLYNVQRDVDILLGADVYNDIILAENKKGPAFAPTAQRTEFGWVLSGRVSSVFAGAALSHHSMTQVERKPEDADTRRCRSGGNDCRVYVGNLPPDIRTKDIEKRFSSFGKISRVDLKKKRGLPFAFMEFEDHRDAEKAVNERDGYDYDGHKLRVEFPKKGRQNGNFNWRGGGGGSGPRIRSTRRSQHRVLISGLPLSGSWQDLKDHMREAGDVCYADTFKNGNGVVEFRRYEDMKYAIKKLDDSKFQSHKGEIAYLNVRED